MKDQAIDNKELILALEELEKEKGINKESHGIGLKNVKMIVEEQGGEMQVIWVNNRFVVKVMLYLSALNE